MIIKTIDATFTQPYILTLGVLEVRSGVNSLQFPSWVLDISQDDQANF